jgi:very-short-patch-repair endonuclease
MANRSIQRAEALMMKVTSRQFGLINTAHLHACGLYRQAIHRRVEAGRLVSVLPRVYRVTGTEPADLDAIMAAVLWAGEGAVASHSSAARARGLDGFHETEPHISVTRDLGSAHGIFVHRVDALRPADITQAGPIPITSAPRMLQELAAIRHPRLEKALDQLIREGRVRLPEILAALDRPEAQGRRGIKALRQLVATRTTEHSPSQSEMEDLFKRVVRKHRLPSPKQQYPIKLVDRIIHADFAYPQAALAIECDGYAWHMDRLAFERDRLRDIELQSIGWAVLRFTWEILKCRDRYAAEQVRRQLKLRTQLSL